MKPVQLGKGVELIDRLAAGATSVVFRARATQDLEYAREGTPLAVKILKEEPRDADAERWKRELAIGLNCASPRLIQFFDHGIYETAFGPQPFVIMEWFEGDTLESLVPMIAAMNCMKKRHHFRSVLAQALEGLAYLHEKGIVHRDLQRRNLLVSENGSVKIIDFGTAKVSTAATVTERWEEVGTRRYWPPEYFSYVAEPDKWGSAGDIFMLASCLVHVYSGKYIFSEAETYADFFDQLREYGKGRQTIVPELWSCRQWLGNILYGAVSIMLSPDPEKRLSASLLMRFVRGDFKRYRKKLETDRFPLTALAWATPSRHMAIAQDFLRHLRLIPAGTKIAARELHELGFFKHTEGKDIVSLVETFVLFGLLEAEPIESDEWWLFLRTDPDDSDRIFREEVRLSPTATLGDVGKVLERFSVACKEREMVQHEHHWRHYDWRHYGGYSHHPFLDWELCRFGDQLLLTNKKDTALDEYYMFTAAGLIKPVYLKNTRWTAGRLTEQRTTYRSQRLM